MQQAMYDPWKTAGITIGDVYLTVADAAHKLIARMRENDYFLVDGVTVRITDQKQVGSIPGARSWLVTCTRDNSV